MANGWHIPCLYCDKVVDIDDPLEQLGAVRIVATKTAERRFGGGFRNVSDEELSRLPWDTRVVCRGCRNTGRVVPEEGSFEWELPNARQ